jgi:hypothetical protein
MALALVLASCSATAADLTGPYGRAPEPVLPSSPRYFPRGDGSEPEGVLPPPPRRVVAACTPRRAPVPTNSPDDPSYVGSPYGLGHPSYYGFTPPPGIDDPYGRSLLPYCR